MSRSVNLLKCAAAVTIVFNAACESDEKQEANGSGGGGGSANRSGLEVNIQVTGVENIHPMMDELDRRGMPATVWLSSAEIDAECGSVEEWAAEGHEIAGKYPTSIDDDTSRQDQEEELVAIQQASARCEGGDVIGFRASRFTANDDTYDLLDEQGYGYLERSARSERYSVYTFNPYPLPGRSFAILPMPIVVYFGETSSMCDNACEDMMTPEELLAYEKKAIDVHLRTGEPLIFEWHPETTNPDNETDWWGAFTGLLDHVESLGDRVELVTARDLVERHAE
jgi:peptidoglycan/xylan/chitin deacetylase (PgdA/CDA1 family)